MTSHESNPTSVTERDQKDGGMRQKAQDTAQEIAHEAEDQTRRMASMAKEEARSMVDTGKSQVTSELNTIAQAFRTTGNELQNQNEENVARYTNQIANQIEHASSYLSSKNVDELINDATNFARQQPEVFLGAAFGLGVLVARFFKSSEPDYDYYRGRYGQGYMQRGYSSDYGRQGMYTGYTGTGETDLPARTTGTTGTTRTTGTTGTTGTTRNKEDL